MIVDRKLLVFMTAEGYKKSGIGHCSDTVQSTFSYHFNIIFSTGLTLNSKSLVRGGQVTLRNVLACLTREIGHLRS
jgi:hypothetical protein